MLISNTSYFKAIAGSYNLSPFDLNGNIIPQITIECDSTLGAITIDLFEINILSGRRNFELRVVDVAGQASVNNITIQTTGSDVIDEAGTTQLVLDTDKSGTVISPISNSIWISVDSVSGGGSAGIIPITWTDLNSAKVLSLLIPGATYHITDKDIWVQAVSINELSVQATRLQRIVKAIWYVPAGSTLGVWNSLLTPMPGNNAVWGGSVWLNVNGLNGAPLNDVDLNAEWTKVSTTSDVYYESKIFSVNYDFDNDWVTLQTDDRNNVCGYQYQPFDPYNPVDITDWGNTRIFDNKVAGGIFNNAVGNSIFMNVCSGSIARNFNQFRIYSNTVTQIVDNSSSGNIVGNNNPSLTIEWNSNNGDIRFNECTIIGYNSNSGSINFNRCNAITDNSNNESISYNVVADSIIQNSNNGGIKYNNCDTISGNTNDGDILKNSVLGDISENSNVGEIALNNCQTIASNNNNGSISGNLGGEISGNSNSDYITNNTTTQGVIGNSNNGWIADNVCMSITSNLVSGSIYMNNIIGSITGNSCQEIYNNNNSGDIGNNANTGFIRENKNNGAIIGLTNIVLNVETNNNNGSITNFTLTPGNISDAPVNK